MSISGYSQTIKTKSVREERTKFTKPNYEAFWTVMYLFLDRYNAISVQVMRLLQLDLELSAT